MSPYRPYQLRSLYDWLLDNELTPHLVVDAEQEHVQVPTQFIKDGQIVLNVAPSAVVGFDMDLHQVSFSARFGGVPFQIFVPMSAILAIYARENGAGMVFEPEDAYNADTEEISDEPEEATTEAVADKTQKPTLRVIK